MQLLNLDSRTSRVGKVIVVGSFFSLLPLLLLNTFPWVPMTSEDKDHSIRDVSWPLLGPYEDRLSFEVNHLDNRPERFNSNTDG